MCPSGDSKSGSTIPQVASLDARALQARWVGYDTDSTHAHRIYWPGKNSITVKRNIKFVSPTIIVNTLPPSYASTIAPPQASPPAPPAVPPAQAQPPATQTPVPGVQNVPAAVPQPPPCVFIPPDTPPNALPSTPTVPLRQVGEKEEEVKQTITSRRITVSTAPIAGSSEPCCSGHTSHTPEYYRQLAQEDNNDAEHLDYVFLAEYGDILAGAITNLNDDPKSLSEAKSQSDWPLWKEAMDREIQTLEQARTWHTVSPPSGVNIVGSKWVFRIKHKADSSIKKYKACLVA